MNLKNVLFYFSDQMEYYFLKKVEFWCEFNHVYIFAGAYYCVCKDGVAIKLLQEAIDYACGAGADCTPILQNGPCFQPNTVKDHCNYAVNSYYQRKGNVQGSCDFAGAATVSQTPPSKHLCITITFFYIFVGFYFY
jgi:hypothetical protein